MGKRLRTTLVLTTALSAAIVYIAAGCRRDVNVMFIPSMPKQGDMIDVRIGANDVDNIDEVNYIVNDVEGTSPTAPVIVTLDTCKYAGDYVTSIYVWAEAVWDDGEVRTYGPEQFDIDGVSPMREDDDQQYSIYVAHDHDDFLEELMIAMADKFTDRFDTWGRHQYYWSEERFYASNAINFANGSDLVISFGHGTDHGYYWGPDGPDLVDLSGTEYGAFAPCYMVGDAEYLVFPCCQTLSMDDSGGHTFDWWWVHNMFTYTEARPFTGLHHVMGFRTDFECTKNQGRDLFREFANNMDDGMTMVNAWQEAVGDELRFRDGDNRGTVLYLYTYEDDTVFSDSYDYIYYGDHYHPWQVDTWE